jgi:predicted transcriptional regulator
MKIVGNPFGKYLFVNHFMKGIRYLIRCPKCKKTQVYRPFKNPKTPFTLCQNLECNKRFEVKRYIMLVSEANKTEMALMEIFYKEYDHYFTQHDLINRLNIGKTQICKALRILQLRTLIDKYSIDPKSEEYRKDHSKFKYIRNFSDNWNDYICIFTDSENQICED